MIEKYKTFTVIYSEKKSDNTMYQHTLRQTMISFRMYFNVLDKNTSNNFFKLSKMSNYDENNLIIKF